MNTMTNYMRKALLFTFLISSLVYSAFAQQQLTPQQATLPIQSSQKANVYSQSNYNFQPYNGSAYIQQRLAQQDLNFATNLQAYMQAIPSLSQMNAIPNDDNGDGSIESPPVLTIPVVVHVIHDPADPVGTGTNLSIVQIQSQIDKLNEAFRQQNGNFAGVPLAFQAAAGDAEIEFCLANLGPSGAATNGIDRQSYATSSVVDINYIENNIKPATQWNPSLYLNLWTVAIPNTSPIGGVQGYAYFPVSGFAGSSVLDGVVIDYRFFGVGYNAIGDGVSCIREVGHYLGLPNIWGFTNAQGFPLGCSSDDGLADTPDQEEPTGISFANCPISIPSSCGSPDMYSNYMDYMKNQTCQAMFTNDQNTVMRAVLTGLAGSAGYGDRSSLIASGASTCSSPCAIALSTSFTPESCGGLANGTASVTASGGTPPYQYSWNTNPVQSSATATNLSAGIYQVTASDFSGCQQITRITVTDASTVTGTLSATNETCAGNDGTATITPSGGTAPYTVVWGTTPPQVGNTAIGLKEGVYGVNITDATGCTFSDFTFVYDDCNQECDTLFNADFANAANYTPAVYFNPYNGGFISGTNGFNDLAKADYFDYKGTNSHLLGVALFFGVAIPGSPTSTVEIVAWDGTGGTPGAELGSETINIQDIANALATFQSINIEFTPFVPFNGEVFIGFKIPNAANGDTLALITNTIGQIPDGFNTAWEQTSDGSWQSYKTAWGVDMVHAIVPVVGTPPEPAFTPTNITACDSQSVVFTNLSTNSSDFFWDLPGAVPFIPTTASPVVQYLLPGTYDATLYASNDCLVDSLYLPGAVTINACPTTCDLFATLSSTTVSCNGGSDGSVTVVASAGSGTYTYLWSTNDVTPTVANLVAGNYTVTISDGTGCSVVGNVSIGQPDALALTTNTTDETCANNDGSAYVSVAGGVEPYTYAWNANSVVSDTLSNVTAGTYTVTVTDGNGCTSTASATVVDACTGCALTLSTAFTSPTCNGEATATATVSPSLGTFPYTYNWTSATPSSDSVATNLTASVYSVTVTDALNCVDSAIIVITEPSPVQIFLSANPTTCAGNDGVAVASGSGGVAPYFYAWNTNPIQTTNQIIGLAPGTYPAAVSDVNGCIVIDSVVVANGCPCGDTVMVASTAETCAGNDGTATVTATGGQFSYQWSTSATDTFATVSGLAFGNYSVTATDTSGCQTVATVIVDDGCNCGMVLTTSSTGESCIIGGDGTATVSVGGIGTAPYTYIWNSTPIQTTQTAIGLSLGTYMVTVTDGNGCTQTTSVDVDGTIEVTVDVINASCLQDNGTASAIVTGGDGNYTYLWDLGGNASPDQTITNLSAGTYPLTVTDGNGCSVTTTAAIVQNGTFSVNMNGVDNFCSSFGASISAVAQGGGTAPYSFNWGPPLTGISNANVTNLPTGIYNVTVTDVNGCASTNSITVTSIDAGPQLGITQTNVSCFGDTDGSVDLTVSANTAVSISWDNGVNSEDISNLSAGTYTVVVVDANGCIASTTVNISQPNPLIITGLSTPTISNDGTASATVNGGTPPYTYNWNNGGNTQTITGLIAGTYLVTVTDANGCTNNGSIDVQQFTGTIDIPTLNTFDLYPNPSNGQFTLDLGFDTNEDAEIIIFNTIGQRVWSKNVVGEQFTLPIDLTQQSSGIYFVEIATSNGRAVKRVLIAK